MLASEVMDRSAALLNDTALSSFTYGVQIPFLNIAIDELQEYLEQNNIGITNSTSGIFVITTAMFDIGGPTGPALPTGLIEIQELFERDSGTSEPFISMTRKNFIPEYVVLLQDLIYWSWQNQYIHFKGALTNRDVRIHYISNTLSPITDGNSTISIINAKSFLAYRTAALAAEFIGENPTRAQDLNADASLAIERMIGINVKGSQSIVTRRRPFMAGYKSRTIY